MKALFGVIISVLVFLPILGAENMTEGQREFAKTMQELQKKEVVAQNMRLTKDQGKIFWPLYDKYQEKLKEYNKKWADFYAEFFANYHQMSEKMAGDLLDRYLKLEEGYIRLQRNHVRKFRRKLSPVLVARYFQIENKLDIVREYELTNNFPLIY